MSETLKTIAAMENGGFVLIGLAIVLAVPSLILGIVAIYNIAYYGAVLFRGWPPEYEDSDDDGDDNPSGTFRTTKTRTQLPTDMG